MADDKKIQPGSWVGDTIEEFRKLPTWGKILVGLVVVAVIWLAWYQYQQSKNAAGTSTTPAQAVQGSLLPPGAVDTGQGAPPVGPPPTPTTPPPPASKAPLIPYDFFASHMFPTIPGNPNVNVKTFNYQGVNYNIHPGAGGRVYGQNPATGQSVLLYAPKSYYGSGGMSTSSFMHDPILYWKSVVPHKTTAGLMQ